MTLKRILIGNSNYVDNCNFCGANPQQYKYIFVAPSGATMCDGCHMLILNAMKKSIAQDEEREKNGSNN